MKTRGHTRANILACAEELMQQRGFHGFSYHHIAERMGIRNAAVHYYFPSKGDLGVALIDRFRENFRFWADQLRARRVSPTEAVEGFFDIEQRYCAQARVCPLGVTGVELPGIPEAMRDAVKGLLGDVHTFLTTHLEAGLRSGEFSFQGTAEARAEAVLAALQGGLQLARLTDASAFARVADQVRADLGIDGAARRGRASLREGTESLPASA